MRIDGRAIASDIFLDLKKTTQKLKKQNKFPRLAIVLVGDDPASVSYVNQKVLKGSLIGCTVDLIKFDQKVTQSEILEELQRLNNDDLIHGIIVQQPVPNRLDQGQIISSISKDKDIDGFLYNSKFTPPIALAVFEILKNINNLRNEKSFIEFYLNKNISIIGKGITGGKPIYDLFISLKLNPSLIDSKTENPKDILKKSDLIVSCVGRENVFGKSDIKKNCTVLAVGMHRGEDNKLHADYDETEVSKIAKFYSPVPGGVGPVNVAMLFKNLLEAANNK